MHMELHKSVRKCHKQPNLQAHFRFWDDSSTSTLNEKFSDPENSLTFTPYLMERDPSAPSTRTDRRSLFVDLGLPTIGVVLPLTLLAAAIIGLVVYGRQHISQESFFGEQISTFRSGAFILVNISNSWLLSLSSISSTVAGLMAPVIMMLQMYLNAQAMQQISATDMSSSEVLLTPYQLSLMLGLSSGSPERWWRYERYSRATNNQIPHMLRRTALILKISLLLSAFMFIADQCLHYTTSTVQISQATRTTEVNSFGRGLTGECLSLNREENEGWPCSIDLTLAQTNYTEFVARQNQIFYLQHGISEISNIEAMNADWEHQTCLALLTSRGVEPNVDFRTSTIGVTAQCQPITTECEMKSTGPADAYMSFNCSDNFWGVLNKLPPNNISIVDPDVPPLAFKWSKNLQLGFFTDNALRTPYDTTGLDPSTGLGGSNTPTLPDLKLINPVYFAIAGSFSKTDELAGVDLSTDPSFFSTTSYLGFVLSCSYQTWEVNYTSHNGNLGDFSITPTDNGTIAEIYHGNVQRSNVGGADTQLQDILATAALQSNTIRFAETWAKLFSKEVLSVIGAFTSPRKNFEEQSRELILVTKLPILALAVLLVLNLAYLPIGIYLCRTASRQASKTDIRDIFRRLSIPGVVTSLFSDDISTSSFQKGAAGCGFDERKIFQESTYVEAKLNDEQEYRLVPV